MQGLDGWQEAVDKIEQGAKDQKEQRNVKQSADEAVREN
jgi:hypothetical protein